MNACTACLLQVAPRALRPRRPNLPLAPPAPLVAARGERRAASATERRRPALGPPKPHQKVGQRGTSLPCIILVVLSSVAPPSPLSAHTLLSRPTPPPPACPSSLPPCLPPAPCTPLCTLPRPLPTLVLLLALYRGRWKRCCIAWRTSTWQSSCLLTTPRCASSRCAAAVPGGPRRRRPRSGRAQRTCWVGSSRSRARRCARRAMANSSAGRSGRRSAEAALGLICRLATRGIAARVIVGRVCRVGRVALAVYTGRWTPTIRP